MEKENLLELIHDLFQNINGNAKEGLLEKKDYQVFLERHSKEDQDIIKELMKNLSDLNRIDERKEFFKINYGYGSFRKFSNKIL